MNRSVIFRSTLKSVLVEISHQRLAPWFTTDFPIVEGAQLFDVQADAPTRQLQIQQMLPIWGNYQSQITATPLGVTGGKAIEQTIHFDCSRKFN